MALTAKASSTKQSARWPTKMGLRTEEIRPVGAWVESETDTEHIYSDAVYNAQLEEQRLQQCQREKAEKLRHFQDEVRRRVQALDRAKKQEALEKSYRAVELERSVVRQSALAAEKSTPRKNSCSVRHSVDLSIRHSASVNTQGGIINPNHDQDNQFEAQTHKVHKYTHQARRNLVSRKVITEHYLHKDLPGGVWKTGPTLDHPSSRQMDATATSVEEVEISDNPLATDDLERRIVHFDREPSPENTRERRIMRKSATELCGSQVTRCPAVPNIYPGVQTEEEKTRAQNQRAMYRRLFMDIEREQVKENQRRRQHRKKINDIKRSAEQERRLVEDEAHDLVEPKDPVTGQTEAQSIQQKLREEIRKEQEEEERVKLQQRNKDSQRFLEAIKRNLREKIDKLNIDLPPLCYCGATVWDTSPDTCANNCVFYKNHKAYAAALQSVLASFDVL